MSGINWIRENLLYRIPVRFGRAALQSFAMLGDVREECPQRVVQREPLLLDFFDLLQRGRELLLEVGQHSS
jgi:hypothetical protein